MGRERSAEARDPVEFRDVPDAIWHSSAVSNNGNTVAFGFESFQAGNTSCSGSGERPDGPIMVLRRERPGGAGAEELYSPTRLSEGICTAHKFTVVPGKKKDVLVSAWYGAVVTTVDFTDPAAPRDRVLQ